MNLVPFNFTNPCFWLFQFIFDAPEKCHVVCRREYKKGDKQSKKKLDFIKKGIRMNYQQVRLGMGTEISFRIYKYTFFLSTALDCG